MANLTARFQLIDQMSQKMADIANNGESMLSAPACKRIPLCFWSRSVPLISTV